MQVGVLVSMCVSKVHRGIRKEGEWATGQRLTFPTHLVLNWNLEEFGNFKFQPGLPAHHEGNLSK